MDHVENTAWASCLARADRAHVCVKFGVRAWTLYFPSAETTSQNITLPYRDYESAPPRAFCSSLEDDRDTHAPTKLPSRTSRGLSTPAGSAATACGNPFRRTRGEYIRVVVEHLLRNVNAVITYKHSRARPVVSGRSAVYGPCTQE